MTQFEGISVYKARKILNLKYSTAKQIVNMYKQTGKIQRTNGINKPENDSNSETTPLEITQTNCHQEQKYHHHNNAPISQLSFPDTCFISSKPDQVEPSPFRKALAEKLNVTEFINTEP